MINFLFQKVSSKSMNMNNKHLCGFFFSLILSTTCISVKKSRDSGNQAGDITDENLTNEHLKMKKLLNSLTEGEIDQLSEILHLKLLVKPSEDFLKSNPSYFGNVQEEILPKEMKVSIGNLEKKNLLSSDIGETSDITNGENKNEVLYNTDMFDDLSSEEIIKLAKMSVDEFKQYAKVKLKKVVKRSSLDLEDGKSKSSYLPSKSNEKLNLETKRLFTRDAYPEPEPEPEIEPRPRSFFGQQSSSRSSGLSHNSYYFSQTGYRYKRSPEPEPEPEPELEPQTRYQAGHGYSSYQGSSGSSKTRYGYGGYLNRYRRDTSRLENNDVEVLKEGKVVYETIYNKLTDMVKTTKQNRRAKRSASSDNRKQPSYYAPDFPDSPDYKTHHRRKRHINMEVLMEVLGKRKKVEKPELVYMTAKIEPKKKVEPKLTYQHQNYYSQSQEIKAEVTSQDEHPGHEAHESHQHGKVSSLGYEATDSYSKTMSKAKLVKVH